MRPYVQMNWNALRHPRMTRFKSEILLLFPRPVLIVAISYYSPIYCVLGERYIVYYQDLELIVFSEEHTDLYQDFHVTLCEVNVSLRNCKDSYRSY